MKLPTTLSAAVLALSATAAPPALANDGFRAVFGLNLTFGGETLTTITYTNGDSKNIKSGGLSQIFGGAEFRTGRFAVQANVGYHSDGSSARNGDITFSRIPVEVLSFFHVADSVRLGGGIRKATNVKIKGSGDASSFGRTRFDSDVGLVLQGEYLFGGGRYSVLGRYVFEKYKTSFSSVKGDHGGIGFSFRF
jgi:hypothetical protein